MRSFILVALCICLGSDVVFAQQQDEVFHYSTMEAMRNAVYSGNMAIGEIKDKGDFGLGTYNLLDGELIALDGVFYRVASNGKIEQASPERQIPFASVTFFQQDTLIALSNVKDFEELQNAISQALPSANHFYAIRIHLTFDTVVTGGASRVKPHETKGIAEFMPSRPLYKTSQKTGTIIGFYCPPFIGGVDLSPFHFHFISDDRTYGGHLISGSFKANAKIEVQLDEKEDYKIVLPSVQNEGYQQKWKKMEAQKSY
ncbi:acetolactate decarboxylase [Pedobacter sp. MC2016-05]|uniref:acetolactate decarboxylase n=1 Tax=Pedobacter sp. MC2016-05 TaxID=2994474 RepID=UPI002246B19A|nr:acetolactate decarboxylase [Pedobacter sp. MC2016-05]MCX2477318.1 acetolactate decarboxylase [Pedobacter sp. MC2016-05]